MYQNNKSRLERYFTFLWRCIVLYGLFFVFKEINYIADVMTMYVRMFLDKGSF
jgi:hypothetical protein|tara:strand:- start:237 stop:395 length:159 start_codon:yes stop_codon:yes gene_type:complete